LINTVQLFNVVDAMKVRPDAGRIVTSGKRGGKKLKAAPPCSGLEKADAALNLNNLDED
jgi:hypothetical protein